MVKPLGKQRGEPVVAKLRRQILTGRHRAGSRLPPERELAARLGTNRNTLREALRTLESENLVRASQGDGTIVRDWRASGELNLLPHFLFADAPPDERLGAVLTLLSLRERLLDEVVDRATAAATATSLAPVREAVDALGRARPGIEWARADVEVFHQLVLAAQSLVLTWVFNTFARIFLELGERFPAAWPPSRDYEAGLHVLLSLVAAGQAERARAQLRLLFAERSATLVQILHPQVARTRRPRKAAGQRS